MLHPHLTSFLLMLLPFSLPCLSLCLCQYHVSGEEGVYNVLKLLNEELVLAMKLAGCVSLSDLKPSLLRTALSFQSRL